MVKYCCVVCLVCMCLGVSAWLKIVVEESMGLFFCGSLPQQGYTPLHCAADNDEEEVARALVKLKADLEAKVHA